jgi:hypothetical protein
VSNTRELHDSAMDLFELGMLTARAGNVEESRRLLRASNKTSSLDW